MPICPKAVAITGREDVPAAITKPSGEKRIAAAIMTGISAAKDGELTAELQTTMMRSVPIVIYTRGNWWNLLTRLFMAGRHRSKSITVVVAIIGFVRLYLSSSSKTGLPIDPITPQVPAKLSVNANHESTVCRRSLSKYGVKNGFLSLWALILK